MKRSLRFISLLLLICILVASVAACDFGGNTGDGGGDNTGGNTGNSGNGGSSGNNQGGGSVDYATEVTLDESSGTKQLEVTVKLFIDGDTTHFYVPRDAEDYSEFVDGVLKARYLGINTPESTGRIEEWGKAAAKFTREKLESAEKIIVESDTNKTSRLGLVSSRRWNTIPQPQHRAYAGGPCDSVELS